ncbi:molybdopterin synthase small subunit [bacterium BMS3Bbin11]|nr:molybdopterin synthase small subunit [bacterium BMS3Abin11]GBE46641.1 molybdopterin synthase small subunit [bacterium BMS3Bbin11]GMT40034.1 MAG: hypothetical protein IEMM0001_0769 [bacterium]HDZ79443.1 DUF971 domain-containing protein [Gammaproteobacteria bacterium]
MTQEDNQLTQIPTGIKLHKKSRYLEITYPNGDAYNLPCEYLRVFSPAAEEKVSRAMGNASKGKEEVNINAINPVGSYALQIIFDDGHETGIYSWARLYDMAINLKSDWEDRELTAPEKDQDDQDERTVTILYFAALAKRLGLESETIALPDEVVTINDLIPWLMTRRGEWKKALAGTLKITVNRRFVGMVDMIRDGDEIAFVLVAEENIR